MARTMQSPTTPTALVGAYAPRAGGASSEARVRIAKGDDVYGLVELVNTLAGEASLLFIMPIEGANGASALTQHLAAIAQNRNEAVFVAEYDGRLVGLATAVRGIHPARRGVVEIGIGVLPAYRRHGIGRALMMAVESWAAAIGIDRLQLTVVTTNAPAIALYGAMGFTVEGELKASARVAGRTVGQLMMAKLLASSVIQG